LRSAQYSVSGSTSDLAASRVQLETRITPDGGTNPLRIGHYVRATCSGKARPGHPSRGTAALEGWLWQWAHRLLSLRGLVMKRCARPRWQRRDRSFMYGMRGMFSQARRVTRAARHVPSPSPFLPAWDAVQDQAVEKRGHTLRCRNHHSAPVLPRGGTELILTSLKHLVTTVLQCLAAARYAGQVGNASNGAEPTRPLL
jgi:hypothetical protein